VEALTSKKVTANPRVRYHGLAGDEGGVLLHLDTGQYHGVNSLGSMIWRLLDGTRTGPAITAELRRHLESCPPTLDEDVASFLAALRERDLVLE
jgi:hypothetical protein